MTYEEKLVRLNRYRAACKKERKLKDDLAEAREAAQHTTQSLSAVPGGSGDGQSIARTIERVEALEQEVNAQHEHSVQIYREILDALYENVHDDMDYVILHKRYLENMKWDKIAEDTHFALRWVFTRHRNTVERMDL